MSNYSLYFAYGSNLNQTQMKKRCPGSFVWARARAEGWSLQFGGHSRRWGSPVANLLPSSIHHEYTDGVIYKVSESDVAKLDKAEGHPRVYHRDMIEVVAFLNDGPVEVDVLTYLKDPDDFDPGVLRANQSYAVTMWNAYVMLDFNTEKLNFAMFASEHEATRGRSRRR